MVIIGKDPVEAIDPIGWKGLCLQSKSWHLALHFLVNMRNTDLLIRIVPGTQAWNLNSGTCKHFCIDSVTNCLNSNCVCAVA